MISPNTPHPGPKTSLFSYWFGRLVLSILGWDVTGQVPDYKKFVLIAAPHTSNWDFPIGLSASYIFRLKVSWAGKDALFNHPLGWFMRWLGGISIDRSSSHGVVQQMANKFSESEKLVIAITPSGTRKKVKCWKSGFYWLALEAQVPIACGVLDYGSKTVSIGLTFMPTGNITEDMNKIRKFYDGVEAKYLQNFTPIRIKEED